MRHMLVPLLLLLLLAGCAGLPPSHMYDGPERAASELARVQAESDHEHDVLQGLDARMHITGVDGNNTFQLLGSAITNYPEVVYVLPGTHRFRFQWSQLNSFANIEATFTVEAGHNYLVHKVEDGGRVGVWVEDTTTGQRIPN